MVFKTAGCILHTGRMKSENVQPAAVRPDEEWQKTQCSNQVRQASSDIYYARLRVKGKLIQRSFKPD
jgi:uncharacterized membrane protein YcaP (DUF421 family)